MKKMYNSPEAGLVEFGADVITASACIVASDLFKDGTDSYLDHGNEAHVGQCFYGSTTGLGADDI